MLQTLLGSGLLSVTNRVTTFAEPLTPCPSPRRERVANGRVRCFSPAVRAVPSNAAKVRATVTVKLNRTDSFQD